jgi:hypothetical protein
MIVIIRQYTNCSRTNRTYTRGVNEVEASVPKVVVGLHAIDGQAPCEKLDFEHFASNKVALRSGCVLVERKARSAVVLGTWSHNELGGRGKGGWVSAVIEMRVAIHSK